MITEFTASPLFSAWPFWVLEIDPAADNRTVEKAYQKIVNSLQLKIPKAENFMTPLGPRLRDEFALREARAILTHPEKRAMAEFWYMPALEPVQATTVSGGSDVMDWHSILRGL